MKNGKTFTWKKSKLKKKAAYKFYVAAQKKTGGSYKTIAKSKAKVTKVKAGKKLAKIGKPLFKYISSNTLIATVDAKGKVTAKSKGTAEIYVQTTNGIWKKCKVTVK